MLGVMPSRAVNIGQVYIDTTKTYLTGSPFLLSLFRFYNIKRLLRAAGGLVKAGDHHYAPGVSVKRQGVSSKACVLKNKAAAQGLILWKYWGT